MLTVKHGQNLSLQPKNRNATKSPPLGGLLLCFVLVVHRFKNIAFML